jgi:hypothetical protein
MITLGNALPVKKTNFPRFSSFAVDPKHPDDSTLKYFTSRHISGKKS